MRNSQTFPQVRPPVHQFSLHCIKMSDCLPVVKVSTLWWKSHHSELPIISLTFHAKYLVFKKKLSSK